jgi:hypothetical protein
LPFFFFFLSLSSWNSSSITHTQMITG